MMTYNEKTILQIVAIDESWYIVLYQTNLNKLFYYDKKEHFL